MSAREDRRPAAAAQASSGGGNAVYGLGLIGSLVWFFQQADGFGGYVWGAVKAVLWPAFLAYEGFGALGG